MASKYVRMTGFIKWANSQYGGLFSPDPSYGNYSVTFYPDPPSVEKFKASGMKLEFKNDEDGDFVKLRRPHEKIIKNENQVFGRPKIFFPEGVEGTKDIGNGTKVEVTVVVYPAGRHTGHRLESVKVLELVRFERAGEGGFKEFTDGSSTPSEVVVSEKGGAKAVRETSNEGSPFNDDVPFGEETPKEEVKKSPFKRMSR